MALFNTVYSNEVLSSTFENILSTKINTRSLMGLNTELADKAGMKISINKYTYDGTVEAVAEGDGSTAYGTLTVEPVDYDLSVYQHAFKYSDEELMSDGNTLDFLMRGASQEMANHMTSQFFAELAKATLSETYAKGGALGYDDIVDAIAKMNVEDESNLFVLMGNDLKAAIRKDADFTASKLSEIIYTGEFGSISGLPVIFSKAVPAKTAYVLEKGAVTLFLKKDNQVEQGRNADTRTNTVFMRKVGVVALTDATKVVKITEALA